MTQLHLCAAKVTFNLTLAREVKGHFSCTKMFGLVGFSRVLHHRTVYMAATAGCGRNFSTETALRAPIERVSVIGSGLMGSGIAQVINKSLSLTLLSLDFFLVVLEPDP